MQAQVWILKPYLVSKPNIDANPQILPLSGAVIQSTVGGCWYSQDPANAIDAEPN